MRARPDEPKKDVVDGSLMMGATRAAWRWTRRWIPGVGAVTLAVILAGCGMRTAPGMASTGAGMAAPAAGSGAACVLVDSDAALDDFRAVASLVARARLVGVVVTEGVATPAGGAMAMTHLLASANATGPVAVLIGEGSPSPALESWIPEARANAERLNGFVAVGVPLARGPSSLSDEVERLTRECGEVRILVIGPWTSFVRYQSRLGGRLRQVVAQGLPFEDVPAGRSPGFNCRYDLVACREAHAALRASGRGVWVDVPRNATPPYAPTPEMIQALGGTGLPGTLRAILFANPKGWADTLMWDDSAALYLLHPQAFGPKAAHVEPTVAPDEIRRLWLAAANGG
jgi:inosine-uridine nucleoside N-ribohydrolase